MKIFSPALREIARTSFGRQLRTDSNGYLNLKNSFIIEGEEKNGLNESVNKYIQKYQDTSGNIDKFLTVLNSKVSEATEATRNYSL